MAKTGSRAMGRVTLTQVKEYLAQVPEIVKAPSPSEQWMVEAKLADAPNVRMLHDAEQRLRMLDMIDTGIKPRTPPPPPPNTPLNNNMQPLAHSVPSAPLTRDAKGDGLRVSHKAFTKLFGGEMASPTSALRARPKWWSTPIVTPNVVRPTQHRAASAPRGGRTRVGRLTLRNGRNGRGASCRSSARDPSTGPSPPPPRGSYHH